MALRVLVASRDRQALERLEPALAGAGYEVFCAGDPERARDLARRAQPEVLLWGLFEGEAAAPAGLLRELPGSCAIALGADAASLPQGFLDALPLPCPDARLRPALERAGAWCRLQQELLRLRRELAGNADARPIVGASPGMIELLEATERAAGFRACVLLRGERGTGKEGLARAVHALSDRRAGPFVAVACRQADPEALAAELFGRPPEPGPAVQGALREADGGTLFLDDVDALPAVCQRRLLLVLESEELASPGLAKPRPVDLRVTAATTRDLRAAVSTDDFSAELLERLRGFELAVPALRERAEDVPLLVDHFTARASASLGRPRPALADDALAKLVAYRWPGNLRELENVVERAVLTARGGRISALDLPDQLEAEAGGRGGDFALRRARKRLEVQIIRRALHQTGGNRTHAARLLEISHRALLYKLKEYGIRD